MGKKVWRQEASDEDSPASVPEGLQCLLLSHRKENQGQQPGVWHTSVMPELEGLRQEDRCKIEANLGYTVGPVSKTKK